MAKAKKKAKKRGAIARFLGLKANPRAKTKPKGGERPRPKKGAKLKGSAATKRLARRNARRLSDPERDKTMAARRSTTGTPAKSKRRKAKGKGKAASKPKRKGAAKLSKAAFLARMAKGRAAAARKRGGGSAKPKRRKARGKGKAASKPKRRKARKGAKRKPRGVKANPHISKAQQKKMQAARRRKAKGGGKRKRKSAKKRKSAPRAAKSHAGHATHAEVKNLGEHVHALTKDVREVQGEVKKVTKRLDIVEEATADRIKKLADKVQKREAAIERDIDSIRGGGGD